MSSEYNGLREIDEDSLEIAIETYKRIYEKLINDKNFLSKAKEDFNKLYSNTPQKNLKNLNIENCL